MQIAGKGGVIVAGRATRDAEVQKVGAKQTLRAKFGLAIGKNEKDETIYADVVAWRHLAEYAACVVKGAAVIVAGHIVTHEYNGKTYTELEADWLDCKGELNQAYQPMADVQGEFVQVQDDDLPF